MRHNLPEIAEMLLKAGANPNVQDEGLADGTATLRTICHDVAASGYIHTLKCLLRYGGDITVVDKWDNTPAHIAAKCGHVKMVQYLSLGMRLDMRNADGLTPLDHLCTLDDPACKQWLDYISGKYIKYILYKFNAGNEFHMNFQSIKPRVVQFSMP